MKPADIFDRHRRRLVRDRAQPGYGSFDFLDRAMREGIADRLALVSRRFEDALEIGCAGTAPALAPPGARVARLDPGFRFAAAAGGAVQGDEDALPFADGAFDLVLAIGTLDTVTDVPGALALMRRVLRPDGLLLAAFTGGETLATLRAVLREVEGDAPAARLHPRIDVRAAGDLLVRAGFALPVADVEVLRVRYAGLFGLLGDLRGLAAGNLLSGPAPLSRATLGRAAAAFAARADPDGRTAERFDIVVLTGWAPAPGQPVPARRGSATASLADALRPR